MYVILLLQQTPDSRNEYGHFISSAPYSQQLQYVTPSGETPNQSFSKQTNSPKLNLSFQNLHE